MFFGGFMVERKLFFQFRREVARLLPSLTTRHAQQQQDELHGKLLKVFPRLSFWVLGVLTFTKTERQVRMRISEGGWAAGESFIVRVVCNNKRWLPAFPDLSFVKEFKEERKPPRRVWPVK